MRRVGLVGSRGVALATTMAFGTVREGLARSVEGRRCFGGIRRVSPVDPRGVALATTMAFGTVREGLARSVEGCGGFGGMRRVGPVGPRGVALGICAVEGGAAGNRVSNVCRE